jgi:hypothetical protein
MLEQVNSNFKNTLKRYLYEIVAIFMGISISFWFDEWRDNRKDREMEQEILQNLRENLVQDSLVLGKTATGVEWMIKGAEKLIHFKEDAEIADSVSYFIDMAASYTGILPNQTTYEEMKQTGRTSLIQDDTLKKAILGHYTNLIPFVKEWCDVDKSHTMSQLIPEMVNYFPVVIDTLGIVSAAHKIKQLKSPKLRHLLMTNLTYKKEAMKMIKVANTNTQRLIKRIDKSLKK